MLELDMELPPHALCDDPSGVLEQDLAGAPCEWWAGDGLTEAPAQGGVIEWHPRLGTVTAHQTDPNTGNSTIGGAGPRRGLKLREEVHCGLVAEGVVRDAAQVSLAVRYLPPETGEARTIWTLNTGGAARKRPGENYLYASETEGVVTVKDDAGSVSVTLDAPPLDTTRLLVVGVAGGRVSVRMIGGAEGHEEASAPILSGAASLFIGCRNQRPKLLKTLGGALIRDVMLWPGRDVLTGRNGTLHALERFALWSERM